jgi:hypothetical protein
MLVARLADARGLLGGLRRADALRVLAIGAPLVLAATVALMVNAGPARASQVSTPTVDVSKPSNAAGARTKYVIGFQVSPTGQLDPGDDIRITFPTGTGFAPGFNDAQVFNVTTNQDVGGCFLTASGLTVTCFINNGEVVKGSDELVITLNGITNPPAGDKTLQVETDADLDPATSSNYNVLPANALTVLSVDHTKPSPAAGARTKYVIDFQASATGGLAADANSRITVTFPTGTGFAPGFNNADVFNITTNQDVGSCFLTPTGLTVTCFLDSGDVVNANNRVRITMNGITNPTSTGNKQLQVSTTSDTSDDSPDYNVVDPTTPLSVLGVDHTKPSAAAGARTKYLIDVKVSPTGGLAADANSRLTVTLPAGTGFAPGFNNADVFNMTTNQDVGSCFLTPSGSTVTCFLDFGDVVNPNDQLRITLNGITNPPAGDKTLQVSTTSDTTGGTSPNYNVAEPLEQLTVQSVTHGSPSPAAGARTKYLIDFQVSDTGGLAADANSQITVTLPAGTGFAPGFNNADVFNITTNQDVGSCFLTPSGSTVTCFLDFGDVVNANDQLRITLNGITNPSTPGNKQLQVATTSDTAADSSPDFNVAPGGQLSSVGLTLGSDAPGATTDWFATFFVSATGGLAADANSRLTVTFPSGTTFGSYNGADVFNLTTNQDVGGCFLTPSGLTVTCFLDFGDVVNANDQLRITFNNVTNPSSSGPYAVEAATTSDIVPTQSGPGGDLNPPDTLIDSGPAGVTGESSPTFTFSSTEPGSSFACSVDSGAYAPCTSPFTTSFLSDGPHTFQVRATDAAGNVDPTPAGRAFTVNTAPGDADGDGVPDTTDRCPAVPANTADGCPAVPDTLEELPNPELGIAMNVQEVSGEVLVGIPAGLARGSGGPAQVSQKGVAFVPLSQVRQIPIGSFLDTRRGAVRLQTARDRLGTRQNGDFSRGLFQVLQSRRSRGLTDVVLKGASFASCRRAGRGKRAAAASLRRRLRANARGRFRTRGRHSAATVRGTIWEVQDRCDGTLTKVSRGRVAVRDFRRKKTILLRAGKRYLAKAPR